MDRQSFAIALRQEGGEFEVLTEYTFDVVQLQKDKIEVRSNYPIGILNI
jgi:hypothetical protein